MSYSRNNDNDEMLWVTYQESLAIRRAIIARHREFIQRRLLQNMPTKLIIPISVSLILIGLVELALQIVLIAESGPLYYIAHGIWGGLVTFLFAAICLLLFKFRTYKLYIGALVTSIFYFALIIAAFIALPVASIQISEGGCSSLEKYEKEGGETCYSSQLGIVIAMTALGLLALSLTLTFLIALPIIINGGCSMGTFYINQDEANLEMNGSAGNNANIRRHSDNVNHNENFQDEEHI